MSDSYYLQHRASTGLFYCKACRLPRGKILLTDINLTVSFILIYRYGFKVLDQALAAYILLEINSSKQNPTKTTIHRAQHTSSKQSQTSPQNSHTTTPKCLSNIIIESLQIFLMVILLLLANDIKLNPGPQYQAPSRELTLLHLNVGSLRYKLDAVETETNTCDIVTVSETWLDDGDKNENLLLSGFNPPIRLDRDGHGGVAIYVKSDMICKTREDLHVDGLEAIWIEANVDKNTLLVCSMYRPPSSRVAYWRLIDESIKKASDTAHKFVILGDFNSDCINDEYYEHYQLRDIIQRNNLTQLINEPTRITATTARCIDLILISNHEIVSESSVLPPLCSDHHLTRVKLKIKKKIKSKVTRTIFNYSKLNKEMFVEKLAEIDFIDYFTYNTVHNSANFFSESLIEIAKQCMPVKKITIRENSPEWFDESIVSLREEKYFIHYLAKQLNTVHIWEIFRRIRNAYTDLIRKKKKEHLDKLDNRISNRENFGTKQWWKLVNNFLKSKNAGNNEIPPLVVNNDIFHSNTEKAECLNTFFSNQSKVEGSNDPLPPLQFSISQIEQIHILQADVASVIQHLDTNKAVGPDLVHNKLLIAAGPIINEALTFLFNKSVNEGEFPQIWKIAHVTPIYKLKGEKSDCINYRPISLLSCVGKVLEKCIQKYLLQYLKQNNIITPSQSGFRQGDSAIYQLLNIYDDFSSALDKRIPTQAIFFDISKAFDRVWHRGLIHKLDSVGIRGKILEWIKSYLSDRKQAVVVKGEASSFLPVSAGVPQGSVLGPLFFLIYINDINLNLESTTKLFADDTSAYLSLDNDIQREEILNSDLNKISLWATTWKVKFSAPKTDLLNISRRREPFVNNLRFNTITLQPSTSHRHLGITFQNDCKWNTHINSLLSKCRPMVACLKSYKYRLSRKSLEIMFKSFILPILDYADVVWDNCAQYLAEDLEELQRDAIRTIVGTVRGTSHECLYRESGFVSLKDRRERHKLIIFFKYVNGMLPEHQTSKFPELAATTNPYPSRRPLARNNNLCRTALHNSSFFPSTISLWNDLPAEIKTLTSIGAFKRYLTQNDHSVPPYYYIGERSAQIAHCKLRIKMSDLNFDLFNRHIKPCMKFSCTAEKEDAEHFLLYCPLFNTHRKTTIDILPHIAKHCNTLLHGNDKFSIAFNSYIILTVHEFITITKRFQT